MPPRADGAPPSRPLREALFTGLERLLSFTIERLDWRGAQSFGRAIGGFGWTFARRDRRRTLEHLSIAFPERTVAERVRLGRASFRHFGAMLAECLWLRSRGSEELSRRVEIVGWEEVERLRSDGRPILMVSAHCGNWEMLHAAVNARGLGMAVVVREVEEGVLQSLLQDLRTRFGTPTILRGTRSAGRALLRSIRSGGALGIMLDQDTNVDGVWVSFFGKPAWTAVGAAEIAARGNVGTLPAFIERRPDGSHRLSIAPELELPADRVAATQAMTACIEEQIRRVPEQWVWMHRRWRRQPETGES